MRNKKPSKQQLKIQSMEFNSLAELNKKKVEITTAQRKEQERISKAIQRLQRKENRLYDGTPGRADFLLAVGNKVKEKLKGGLVTIMGPFGVCSEMSVWVFKGNDSNNLEDILFDLCTVSDGDGGFKIRTHKDLGGYSENSIGKMNGMNRETLEPTEEMTIDWMIEQYNKNNL